MNNKQPIPETKPEKPQPQDDFQDYQTTLWESHIKISDPDSGEVLLNQRD